MQNRYTVALLALLMIRPAFAGDIAERAQRIDVVARQWPRPDDLAYAALLQREYQGAFGTLDDPILLRSERDGDLKLHWDAVETTAFYSSDDATIDAARRVYDELERRGLADRKATGRMFDFLLKGRRFGAARDFAARHSAAGLAPVPDFIESATSLPSAWRFDADGGTARRIGIDLHPLQIVVVAGCHFSADAARDIAGDPVLGPAFVRHARWLSLPPGNEKLDALAEWNREFPQTPMLPIHDRSEWALIPQWAMPTFAVVKDGKVIDSVKGWRSGEPEFREQLLAMLKRTGLLEAGAR